MDEETGVLEKVTSDVLQWGLGPIWGRLARLGTGSVATSALVVGGAIVVHRLVGSRGRRLLAFAGGAALVPLGLLWLYSNSGEHVGEDSEEEADLEAET